DQLINPEIRIEKASHSRRENEGKSDVRHPHRIQDKKRNRNKTHEKELKGDEFVRRQLFSKTGRNEAPTILDPSAVPHLFSSNHRNNVLSEKRTGRLDEFRGRL